MAEPRDQSPPLADLSPTIRAWRVGPGKVLTLARPRIVAILNVTPDSFFAGSRLPSAAAAADAASAAIAQGADALDIGGESTRPGSGRVGADEQMRRVVSAIHAIRAGSGRMSVVPLSVDTTWTTVAEAALDAGADAINDVSAGTEDPGMLALAARRGAGLVLMHRLRPPGEDSYSDRYRAPPDYSRAGDVVAAVRAFLAERAAVAQRAGVDPRAIVLDPGLGFGKTVEQNLELILRTNALAALGFPIMSGISRKSFTGAWAGLQDSRPEDRLAASVALALEHRRAGASIFRVHDVAAHAAALRPEETERPATAGKLRETE